MSRIPGRRRLFRLDRGVKSVERDVSEELQFHFDQTVQELIAAGRAPDEARREAEARFGDLGATRARLADIDRHRVERERRAEWWEAIWQDATYAVRGLRMKPGFATAVVVTLGLGIGVNAAMFGVIDRLLFRPPAFMTDAARVNRVWFARTYDGRETFTTNFQYRRYQDLRRWTTKFDRVAGFWFSRQIVGSGPDARDAVVGGVSASYFSFFGARPETGRWFTAAEDTTASPALVAVLGHGFWQSQFGGRTDIVGQHLRIRDADYEIIGVAPEGMAAVEGQSVVAFVPITAMGERLSDRDNPAQYYAGYEISWMEMMVHRREGVTPAEATAELTEAFRRSYLADVAMRQHMMPIESVKPRALATPIERQRGPRPGADTKVATWLAGVTVIVLLIACANVANLLLARAFGRRREIAVRLALGVSRGRLLAQLLMESVLLAALGGAAGLVIAQWGGGIIRALFLPQYEWRGALMDPRTLAFTAGATLLAAVLAGLVPALGAGRVEVAGALKSGVREGTWHRSRLRVALLVFQGALSVVLLVGAGLFVRSLQNAVHYPLGYDPGQLLWVNAHMRGTPLSPQASATLRRTLRDRAARLPGVASAALVITVPFLQSWDEDIFTPGVDSAGRFGYFQLQAVSPEYFATAGTRILKGRGIEATDIAGAPRVMAVSEGMARALWKGEDPIGRCVRVGADTAPCNTVIGVAENITRESFGSDPGLQYYLSAAQFHPERGGMFVRTRGEAASVAAAVRRALQEIVPGDGYLAATPMSEVLDPVTRSWRLGATLFVAFGGLALLLATIGLYSVIAYNVAQRTHELGVRVALGARAADVARLVLNEGIGLAVSGLLLGAAVALWAAKFVEPLLFNEPPRDPVVFAIVSASLLAAAVGASLVPAVRATRVDPVTALRAD